VSSPRGSRSARRTRHGCTRRRKPRRASWSTSTRIRAQYLRQLEGAKVHRAEAIELLEVDRALIGDLVARLGRRLAFTLSVTGGELYLSIGDETFSGSTRRLTLP